MEENVYTVVVYDSLNRERGMFFIDEEGYVWFIDGKKRKQVQTVTDLIKLAGRTTSTVFKPIRLTFYVNRLCYGSYYFDNSTDCRLCIQSFIDNPVDTLNTIRNRFS